jgi:hypothetical protein
MKKKNPATHGTPLSLPLGGKSYLQDWLKRLGVNHSKGDINLRNDVDGWRCLTAKILAEVVCAAAQTEDITLAREAKEWLTSPVAEMMFEECNLQYDALSSWLAAGCPLPEDKALLAAEDKAVDYYQGISYGRLTLDRYDPFYPEDILDILKDVCDPSH